MVYGGQIDMNERGVKVLDGGKAFDWGRVSIDSVRRCDCLRA